MEEKITDNSSWTIFKKGIIEKIPHGIIVLIGFLFWEDLHSWFIYGLNELYIKILLITTAIVYCGRYFIGRIKDGKNFNFRRLFSFYLFLFSISISLGVSWYAKSVWLPKSRLASHKNFTIAIAKFIAIGDGAKGYDVDAFVDNLSDGIKDVNGINENSIEVLKIGEIPECQDGEKKDVRKKIEKLGMEYGADVIICGKIRSDYPESYYFNYHIIEIKKREDHNDVVQIPLDIFESKHSSNFTLEIGPSNNDKKRDKEKNVNEIGDFVRFLYAYANWSSGKKDIAKDIFSSLKNKEQYISDCYDSVKELNDNKQYDVAIPFIELALAIDENSHNGWSWLGYTYSHLQNYDKAMDAYERANKLDEKDYTYNNMGLACHNQEKYEDAIYNYKEALRLNKNYTPALANLGSTYTSIGNIFYDDSKKYSEAVFNYEEALKFYKKATELDVKYDDAWNGLGNVYYNLREYENAKINYKIATELDIDKKKVSYWNNLGDTYYILEEYENAIINYEIATGLDKKNAFYWNDLGNAYYYSDKYSYEEAASAYVNAVELDLKNDEFQKNLGYAYYYSDRYDEATAAFNEALRLNPDNEIAKKGLAITQKSKME